jgi:predicted Zn-dependent protease
MRGLQSAVYAAVLAVSCVSAWGHPGVDEQIADLTELIAKEPENGTLFLRRGELHRIHREWDKATADYLAARKLDPGLAAVDLCMGRTKLEAGLPKEALEPLDRYLRSRPTDAEGRATRARVYRKLGKNLAAARDYDAAVANAKSGRPRPEYYLERARALDAAGPSHLDEAIRGLDDGLATLGEPVTLMLYAIELEVQSKRYDSALARLDRLLARAARKETWLVRRGEILEAAGRPTHARQAYTQALEAIEGLPASRRNNRAVERLADAARTGRERLVAVGGSETR